MGRTRITLAGTAALLALGGLSSVAWNVHGLRETLGLYALSGLILLTCVGTCVRAARRGPEANQTGSAAYAYSVCIACVLWWMTCFFPGHLGTRMRAKWEFEHGYAPAMRHCVEELRALPTPGFGKIDPWAALHARVEECRYWHGIPGFAALFIRYRGPRGGYRGYLYCDDWNESALVRERVRPSWIFPLEPGWYAVEGRGLR